MSKRIGKESSQITLRLDDAILVRVDAIAEEISKKVGGITYGRSATIRVLIFHGLDATEKKYFGKSK